jgi:hypothetical protein
MKSLSRRRYYTPYEALEAGDVAALEINAPRSLKF